MTAIYAPREPSRELLLVIERLANANRSDTCIVSATTLTRLVLTWFGLHRSIRWTWYHLRAAAREQLVIRQTRWRAVNGKLVIKARNRYRLTWRYLQRQLRGARTGLKLAALITSAARRQTVQKVALGLYDLLRSVVPQAP